MPTTLNRTQRATAHARFVDAHGDPAPIVGDVVWEAAAPGVLDFAILSAQNLDVDLVPLADGTTEITARGWSADPAVGRLALTATVQVVAPPAVGGAIVIDAPRAG